MTIIKPVSRRWFLGGLIAAPVIVAASNIMPVRAMEWIGTTKWEGTAGDCAWRTLPAQLVKVPGGWGPWGYAANGQWLPGERLPDQLLPSIEVKHRSLLTPEEWAQACLQGSEGERNPASIDFDAHRLEPDRTLSGREVHTHAGTHRYGPAIPVTENDAPRDAFPREFRSGIPDLRRRDRRVLTKHIGVI